MRRNAIRSLLHRAAVIAAVLLFSLSLIPFEVSASDPAQQPAAQETASQGTAPASPDVVPEAAKEWQPPATAEKVQMRIDELQKEMDLLQKQREDLQKEEGIESEPPCRS
jgi:hypothetical protein